MKYGLLTYRQHHINIGDIMQTIGMEQVYRRLGIKSEDIIEIDKRCLTDYKGDYVILPMAANCDYWYKSRMFPLSNKIIPIFFGFRCVDDFHLRYLEQYKETHIFGCRDVANMKLLRKNGYNAFVSGCLSLQVGRRRNKSPLKGKIYIIDGPANIIEHIPKDKQDRVVYYTNKYILKDLSIEEAERFAVQEAKDRLNLLQTEAELVVTNRLHCALPCLALGIPVILILSNTGLEDRYSGYTQYIDTYTTLQYSQINWDIKPKDITDIQEKQFEVFEKMLKTAENKYKDWTELSNFFENDRMMPYYTGIGVAKGYISSWQQKQFLLGNTIETNYFAYVLGKKLNNVNIVIWGAGDKGKWMYFRYQNELEMCKSIVYVDSNREKQGKKLNGITICNPEIINNYQREDIAVIVAINHSYDTAAYEIKNELVSNFGLEEGVDFYMLDRLNETARYTISDWGSYGWMDEVVWR